mmetsp:Transcript_55080/g.133826  ORF Transcript_55080/g.133826 Transcript_55080/m.133826 type:complete len:620 (-) Transcript_55080:229-2088(-)
MGNQPSGTSSSATTSSSTHITPEDRFRPLVAPFVRQTGSLGLSRQELDKRCQPSGLYQDCQWEDKAIRRLIADGRLAARLKGSDDRRTVCEQECPVCMLYYDEVNVTKCCNALICSECFLQIRPQKGKDSSCPYCNSTVKFSISIAKKPTTKEINNRTREEQTVIEAKIRATNPSMGDNNNSCNCDTAGLKKPPPTDATSSNGAGSAKIAPDIAAPSTPLSSTPTKTVGFGSELEKDERYKLLKKRSESFASNEGNKTPEKDREVIQSIAMTPEERRRLEEEMKAQHFHPLALQIESEAEQRRMENDRQFYRNNPDSVARAQRAAALGAGGSRRLRSRFGGQGPRDWNNIVDAFERGGNGEVTSLDDLVVLEAAILLSMDEEARRSQEGGGGDAEGGASADRASSSSATRGGFDVNRHAREGFPLVRSLLGGREERSGSNSGGATDSASSTSVSSVARSRDSGSSSSNSLRRRARGLMGNTALETASMMMRGISEEEQIAMAIAASIQDQNADNGDDDENNNNGDDENNSDSSESSSEESSSSSSNDDTPHRDTNVQDGVDATATTTTMAEDVTIEESHPAEDDESNHHSDAVDTQEETATSSSGGDDNASDNQTNQTA